jgi:hypothetical protein
VIFGALDKGQTLSSRAVSYDDTSCRILAYSVIATTFVVWRSARRSCATRILKRMQGTPLPRWAYVAARIGSTLLSVGSRS